MCWWHVSCRDAALLLQSGPVGMEGGSKTRGCWGDPGSYCSWGRALPCPTDSLAEPVLFVVLIQCLKEHTCVTVEGDSAVYTEDTVECFKPVLKSFPRLDELSKNHSLFIIITSNLSNVFQFFHQLSTVLHLFF